MNMSTAFIAVHAGAGFHSHDKQSVYEALCKDTCKQVIEMMKSGCSAVDAVTFAVKLLEDSSLTNAGTGSNLTECGKVECDASIMDGNTLNFAAIGAVSDIKNPIEVAKELLIQQNDGPLSLGRIPPCVLVGKGAEEWALKNGFKLEPPQSLTSDSALEAFKKYKRKLHNYEERSKRKCLKNTVSPEQVKEPSFQAKETLNSEVKLDTVGAICLDRNGNIASAVSSGGIALKHSGRVGQAALFGCGCWAQNSSDTKQHCIGVTTSGGGEYLIKTLFAKECANCILSHDDSLIAVTEAIEEKFLRSPFLKKVKDKLAGALILDYIPSEDSCELLWAHTTCSMCIGCMSSDSNKPKAIISRLPANVNPGQKALVEGTRVKLKTNKQT